MEGRRIFAIGETLLDIVIKGGRPLVATPGGSTLNTSVSLARMGLAVEFISEYGEDKTGDVVDEFLRANGVRTGYVHRYEGETALAIAHLDEKNNADYSFYKPYPKERLPIVFPELKKEDIVLFGSFYAIDPVIHEKIVPFLRQAREVGAMVVYDPNCRAKSLQYKESIAENMRLATLIKASDEDLKMLYGDVALEEVHPYVGKEKVLVCTAGGEAVKMLVGGKQYECAVERIEKPVSTIGAGDNFTAGLVYYLCKHGLNLESLGEEDIIGAMRMGCAFAGEVCRQDVNYVSEGFVRKMLDDK